MSKGLIGVKNIHRRYECFGSFFVFIDKWKICEEEKEIGNRGKEGGIMLLDCVGRTKEDIGRDVEDWRRRTKITQTELVYIPFK